MSGLGEILGPNKTYSTYHNIVRTNQLYAGTIIASDINFGSLTYNLLAASDVAAGIISVGQVNALNITVNQLNASDITTNNIYANNGYIDTIRSSDGFFQNLTVDTLTAANLSFSAAAVSDLTTGNLITNNLTASDIISNTAIINVAEIYQLESSDIRTGNLTIDDTMSLQNAGDNFYTIINSLSTGSKLLSLPSITQASDIIVSNTSTSAISNKTITSATNTVYSKGLFASSDRVLTTTASYPLAVGDVLAYTGSDLQFTTPSFTQASDIRVGNIKIDDNLWVQNDTGVNYTKIHSAATSDVNILIPNPAKVDETFVLLDLAQTFTNKTITDVSNTVYAKGLKTSSDVNLLTNNSHPTAANQVLTYNGTNNLQWTAPTITTASDLRVGNLTIDDTLKLQNAANSNYTTITSLQSFTNTMQIPISTGSTDTLVSNTSASTMTNKTLTDPATNLIYANGFYNGSDIALITDATVPTASNQVLTYNGTNTLQWATPVVSPPTSTFQAGNSQYWQVSPNSDVQTFCYDWDKKSGPTIIAPTNYTRNLTAVRSAYFGTVATFGQYYSNTLSSLTQNLYMGSTANIGGFTYGCEFGLPSRASDIKASYFLGAVNLPTAADFLQGSDINLVPNKVGFGCTQSDTTWKFMHNGGNGAAATTYDTGLSCRNMSSNVLLRGEFTVNPGVGTVSYSLTDLNNNTTATGTASGTYGTTLPSDTLLMNIQVNAVKNTLDGNVVGGVCLVKQYINRPNG